jgi:zinc protease
MTRMRLARSSFLLAAPLLAVLLLALTPRLAGAVEVERVVSPGGIEAWLIEDHANPIITLDIGFRGGAVTDPEGKAGRARMTAALLDEGAGELDSQAFQKELADLSIRMGFDAGRDTFTGSLTTLTRNRDRAFELLRQALSEPRFDAEPVERIRQQLIVRANRDAVDPQSVAWQTLVEALYPDHPYGRRTDGNPESLAAIETADLEAFVAERLARDNLFVGVAGDITPEELAPLLDEVFGGLPAEAAPIAAGAVAPEADGGTIVVEQEVPQSVVALGQSGIARDDPDYYTAYAVNYVLGGGGFASRLYTEVREKRGLAYSVYSYLNPLDLSSLVMGGVATANARVAESLELIRGEWARMAEEGPTAEELADAKTYLTGSFPLRFDSTGALSEILVGMQMENLGIDYLDRRNDFIEAITLEDARRVAAELYHPDELTAVVVGQPEGVEATRAAPGGS